MGKEAFLSEINTSLNEKDSKKVEEMISKTEMDNKSFSDLICVTDLVKHEKCKPMEKNQKNSSIYTKYLTKENMKPKNKIQYNTITHSPIRKVEPKENDKRLKELSNKFLTNKISTDYYIQELKKEGINTESAAIKKCIRNQINGTPMSFREFYTTIQAHKSDTSEQPLSSALQKKKYKRGIQNEDDGKVNSTHLMMPKNKKNGTNEL